MDTPESDDLRIHDVLIIGGGINGAGIARDAAGRGFDVVLVEMDDLASGTSSRSTKLIHGGLRYLEHYEFRLVREALMEREVLWKIAPHIIWPLRFVLPYAKGIRPAWMIRLGLFLYDHIGGRRLLPPTRVLDMREDPAGEPLKPMFRKAFEYSDGWVDDARLVVLNARDAADRGAEIRTRSRVVGARRENELWAVTLEDARSGTIETLHARLMVNTSGPWIDRVLSEVVVRGDVHNVRLVGGSHIVVRRKSEDPRAYFFQNRDGRIIFAIPYEGDFTLIGTTDRDYRGDPGEVRISQEEIAYLCAAASEYFVEPVAPADTVWSYCGVRPLYDDGASKAQEATRDYVLKTDAPEGQAAIISAFGGKITTYRRLAEAMMRRIEEQLGRRGEPWTATACLPGGDFPPDGFDALVAALEARYPFLESRHARRLCRLYGTRARALLGDAASTAELGRNFGADLFEVEVRYLMREEWAQTGEDVLWRRTKQGLRLSAEEARRLDDFLAEAKGRLSAA